jgi:hypothetical protein
MSNDTDVFAVISSSSLIELHKALSYLANKDRTWRLSLDQIKKSSSNEWSVRISGWANENSFGNIWITGSSGEIADLKMKFPQIEVEGWYKDEYSSGPLYDGEKSHEDDLSEDEGNNFLVITVGSLRRSQRGLRLALDLFETALTKICPSLELDYYSDSIPDDPTYPPEIYLSFSNPNNLSEEEMVALVTERLKQICAPQDFVIKVCDHYDNELARSQLGDIDSVNICDSDVSDFENKLEELLAITPKVFSCEPGNLKSHEAKMTDEEGRTALHYIAENNQLDCVPIELLTPENIFKEDHSGETPASIAQKQSCINHLPQECQEKNFGRDLKRLEYISSLSENGRDDLVDHLLENFPNPLYSETKK